MSLDQVYEATWFELSLMIDAYNDKLVDSRWLLAWHLAPLLNHISAFGGGETDVTPKHLMGVTRRKNAEEILAELNEVTNG